MARLVKICHNMMLGVVAQNLAEITVLAEKGGVPRAAFLDFLNNSVMGSVFTRYKSPAFVNLDFTPDVHAGAAAQGLRPRPAPPADELDVPMPVRRRDREPVQASRRAGPRRRGLRDPAGAAGAQRPGSSSSPRTSTVDDGLAAARGELTPWPRPAGRRPGTWASTTSSGSTSTGCATTGSAGPRQSLEASECGAFLLFDFYNIRYTTQTWIGGALGDKMIRYALLARGKEPVLWDFGSAVKHHQLYSPWVPTGELPGRLPRLPRRRSRRRSG